MFQPYPFFHKGRQLLRNAALILVISFFFDYLFEPFNVNRAEHNFDYWVIVLLHSSNGSLAYLTYFFILGLFVIDDDWKIYKEIVAILGCLILIGIGSYLLREVIYDNPKNASVDYLIEEIRNTILVGSIVFLGLTTINFNLQKHKNQRSAKSIGLAYRELDSVEKIEIRAAIAADHFEVNPRDILCVKSDGNYCEFYIHNGHGVEKSLKRISLQNTLEQLSSFSFINKTHRAFLVNTRHVNRIEGNAAGYQLGIEHLDFTVPVSRAHVGSFNR